MLIPTVNHNYIAGYDPERHLLPEDIDHTDLQNVGDNTHTQIDGHISDTSIHFEAGSIDLSGLVPYIGADKDVDLGENNITTSSIIVKEGPGTYNDNSDGNIIGGFTNNEYSTITAGTSESLPKKGCFAFGCAYGGTIESINNGSFAQGYSAFSDAYITSSFDGSFAQGYCFNGSITSSNTGSFAQGSSLNGYITSSNAGSFAQGQAGFASIISSGRGSFAQGNADDYSIIASGNGSFAQGYAYVENSIVASAENAVQFGPGENAIADNLQVGTGLSLYGKPSTPPTLRNGMLWQDGTALYIRLNDTTYTVDLTEVI